jgi:sugar lactone lactonase YvrE
MNNKMWRQSIVALIRRECTLRSLTLRLCSLVLLGIFITPTLFGSSRVYAVAGDHAATVVYGQGGSLTTGTANKGGTTANSLSSPIGMDIDSSDNLYVLDHANNRVLYYPAGSTTATRVYGQGGSFSTATSNKGGISANSLSNPDFLSLDSHGNLYVADYGNNRILYYPAGSTTATRVYGQGGSFTTGTGNNGGVSASSLFAPYDVAIDSSDNVYIADNANTRVLYYPSGSTTATRVYGQTGSFTTTTVNKGGITATSLDSPQGVDLDSSGNLYIDDANNNRILYYPSGSTTATRVYGQTGSFTTGTANKGGISATSLNNPNKMRVDPSNNLYIADFGNSRVLYYPSGSTTATRVYGQGGSFTTGTANNGGISANSLSSPIDVVIGSNSDVYISDYGNSRVLKYQTAFSISTQPAASTQLNTPFTVVVSLIDVGSGVTISDFTGTVSVVIKSGTGTSGATLGGTTSVSAVNGVATFSNLSVDTPGTGYILTISTPNITPIDTSAFTIYGTLIFTPLTSPSFAVTLTGATRTVTSQNTFKVNDTTASGVGWHMMITSTQFTATGGATLPTTATTITGVSTACTAGQTCVVPVNGVSSYPITMPAGTTPPTAVKYFSANGGTGTGDVTVTVTFLLTVPPGTAAGTYTSTATETLVKGQ